MATLRLHKPLQKGQEFGSWVLTGKYVPRKGYECQCCFCNEINFVKYAILLKNPTHKICFNKLFRPQLSGFWQYRAFLEKNKFSSS